MKTCPKRATRLPLRWFPLINVKAPAVSEPKPTREMRDSDLVSIGVAK